MYISGLWISKDMFLQRNCRSVRMKKKIILVGIHQGSTLSPLVFILTIKTYFVIGKMLDACVKNVNHADDISRCQASAVKHDSFYNSERTASMIYIYKFLCAQYVELEWWQLSVEENLTCVGDISSGRRGGDGGGTPWQLRKHIVMDNSVVRNFDFARLISKRNV